MSRVDIILSWILQSVENLKHRMGKRPFYFIRAVLHAKGRSWKRFLLQGLRRRFSFTTLIFTPKENMKSEKVKIRSFVRRSEWSTLTPIMTRIIGLRESKAWSGNPKEEPGALFVLICASREPHCMHMKMDIIFFRVVWVYPDGRIWSKLMDAASGQPPSMRG